MLQCHRYALLEMWVLALRLYVPFPHPIRRYCSRPHPILKKYEAKFRRYNSPFSFLFWRVDRGSLKLSSFRGFQDIVLFSCLKLSSGGRNIWAVYHAFANRWSWTYFILLFRLGSLKYASCACVVTGLLPSSHLAPRCPAELLDIVYYIAVLFLPSASSGPQLFLTRWSGSFNIRYMTSY